MSLTDLDTQSDQVRNIWYSWVKDLVANYTGESNRLLAALPMQLMYGADTEQWTAFVSILLSMLGRISGLDTARPLGYTLLVKSWTGIPPIPVPIKDMLMEFSTTLCESTTIVYLASY